MILLPQFVDYYTSTFAAYEAIGSLLKGYSRYNIRGIIFIRLGKFNSIKSLGNYLGFAECTDIMVSTQRRNTDHEVMVGSVPDGL